jgi:trigger factor
MGGLLLMSSVETIDKYNVKLTFEVNAEEFEKALRLSYNKNKSIFHIQGFRKGKAPRKLIERQYGEDVFFEDAINFVLPDAYEQAVKDHNLHAVSKPSIDVLSISQADGAVFVAEISVVEEAVVDGYLALTYQKSDTEPADEEIQTYIDADRDKNSRITTVVRAVEMGDIVTIDFQGVIDDVPFEGGQAEDYRLTIGEGMFIDTFEDQLIGAETGENIFVRVTFPDDYDNGSLAGQLAVFDVKIKEIQEKELPDMDDEFAQDVSEFETFDEYRGDIVKMIRENKEREALVNKDEQIMSQLASNTTVDLPPVMIENRIDEMIRNIENKLKYQRITLDNFLQNIGQSKEQFRESYHDNAVKLIKTDLALAAVAKMENLAATEEEVNTEIEQLTIIFRWNNKEKLELNRDIIANDLASRKAYDFVMEQAVEIS